MNSRSRIFLAIAIAFMGTAAFATPDNLVQGVAVFAKGDTTVVPTGFGAGNAASRLYDDGTNGDTTSGDNTYTSPLFTVLVAATANYKVADDNYSPVNTPDSGGDNLKLTTTTASETVRVFLKTTPFADGFLPEAGSGVYLDGYVWNSAIATTAAASIRVKAVGEFQTELGGGSDWNPDATTGNQAILLDNGLIANGDTTAGDGIYAVSLTGMPAGNYEYKILLNDNFGPAAFGTLGYGDSGNNNLSIAVIAPADNIVITLNANTGRTRYTNDNPLASAGPPWYGTSTAWSTVLGAGTILNDAGTGGDLTAADGVFSRTVTVVTPGLYDLAIRQGIGNSFGQGGGSGGYPFETWAANQVIRVIFDTNTYADGYVPTTNIVFALATVPVTSLNRWSRVAPVGQLASAIGGSDWSADDVGANLADNAGAPDAVANDFIFSRSFAENVPVSNQEVKFVYNRTTLTGYDIQGGGPTDGITVGPSNNPGSGIYTFDGVGNTVFAVDAITGRARVNATYAAPADRAARSHFTSFTAVSDWTMF